MAYVLHLSHAYRTACAHSFSRFFFFNDTATTEIYTLSLHDALPISRDAPFSRAASEKLQNFRVMPGYGAPLVRSEEHTSELQSLRHLVCRLLLEKKKKRRLTVILPYLLRSAARTVVSTMELAESDHV